MITVYGIKNCDTVKKARTWLEQHKLVYQFHDFRVDGITLEQLIEFENIFGWQTLLNKRSTGWRQLTDAQKQDLTRESALQLLMVQPTLIKRPVLKADKTFLLGFDVDEYQSKL